MTRSIAWILAACLSLAGPAPAGEVTPDGDDFLVWSFDFGPKGTASAMSPNGSFVVGWDAYFCCMSARGFDKDLNGSLIWDLTPGFPATRDPIDVAALADDDFVVAWESYDELFEEVIHARQFALDGTPLAPSVEVISSADGSINSQPAVEAWPNFSAFLVAWTQDDPNDPGADALDIQLAAFGSADAPQGHFLVNTYTPGDQESPAIAVGADSSFVVVWESIGSPGDDAAGRSIQARWFTPGGTAPDSQFQVNSYTTGAQDNVDVAMAPDGSFLVVWDGPAAGIGRAIQGRLFDSDQAPLGPDFLINSTTSGAPSQPAVEAQADGSFLVAWRSDLGVLGQVVAASGTLVGAELPINSTPAGAYSRPTVAGALSGRFVVTWDSDEDGYYGHKRRARVFLDSLFSDGFESGDTGAWDVMVP